MPFVKNTTSANPASPFPFIGGECAAILSAIDWTRHPLGDPLQWPIELKTVVRVCLTSQFASMVHWGPELYTFYNDAYAARLGRKHPGHLGQPAQDWWSEMWEQLDPFFKKVLAGESYYTENARYTPDRDGSAKEAFFTHSHSPIWDDAGNIRGIYLTVVETTARLAAEARAELLTNELAHRIKNILAVVIALVSQSLRQASDLAGAQVAISNRLLALSRAQDLITQSGDGPVSLRRVVEDIAEIQEGPARRISITGPDVDLSAKSALAFAMALHELSTNAIKHGALASLGGTVSIAWTVHEQLLDMQWVEAGGAAVQAPERTGFGSKLMRGLARDLGGTPKTEYFPAGVQWRLQADLPSITA